MNLEQLSPRQFDRFRDFIYQKSGIRMDARKVSLLSNRIRRRLRAGAFADFDAYYRHVTSAAGTDELEHFLDAITTNETSFFRSPAHFQWFKTEFLPTVASAARRGERENTVRIWSAGCASGAEAYSMAICVAEQMPRLQNWKVTILGTDISEHALRLAREGIFEPRSIEAVTAPQMRRYFQRRPETDSWEVRSQIRERVEFQRHNLMEPIHGPKFDCIFIRNVLIYFDLASKQVVVNNLLAALTDRGFLVVGPSEGIYGMLQPLIKRSAFLYQKPIDPAVDRSVGE